MTDALPKVDCCLLFVPLSCYYKVTTVAPSQTSKMSRGGWLLERPLFSMDPKARAVPSSDVVGFASAANLFIDENTDDLIAVYPQGEIFIFRLDLRSGNPSSAAGDPASPKWIGDTIHLLTGKDDVQVVKCCPLPNRLQTSFMVAVCHNDEEITFYLPPPTPPPSAAAGVSTASSRSKPGGGVAPTKPFAQHICAPRNLRFRSRFYPIRSMWWMESRHFPTSPPSAPSSSASTTASSRAGAASSGGHLQRPGCQQRKFLMVMTQISVELLSVAEELYGNETNYIVLINRVSTRVDYWSFLASGQLRCAIAINESKPTICKPFVVERHSVLTTMPQLTVEGLPTSADGFVSPQSSSHMDAPRLQLQVQPIVLYDTLFVLHVTAQRSVVLHRYVSERSKRSGSTTTADDGERGTPSPSSLVDSNSVMLSSASVVSPGEGSAASSFQGGAFEPYAVLAFGSTFTLPMLALELLRFHVVDNALIVHLTHCQQTVMFDIAAGPAVGADGPFTAGELLLSRAASEASVVGSTEQQNNNSSMAGSNAHFSSFVSSQSAASQQRFFDPSAASVTPRDRSSSPSARPSPRSGGSWMNRLVSWTAGTGGGHPPAGSATSYGPRTRVILPSAVFSLDGIGGTPTSLPPPLSDDDEQQYRLAPPPAAFTGDVYSTHEFYNGWLPLALDRQRGDVRMMYLDVQSVAARISDIPHRVQFLLNRRFCNPHAVPLLLRDLLLEQEGLPSVAQSLDAICSTNLRVAQTKARRGIQRGSAGGGKRQWTNPAYVIVPEHFVPIKCGISGATHMMRGTELTSADEVWCHVKTSRKSALSVIRSVSNLQWDDGTQRHSTDQASMNRVVFGPLANKAAAFNQNQPFREGDTEAPATGVAAQLHLDDNNGTVNKNKYNGSVYFANYILNALLEYTRSLIQHGETLAGATQQCVVNMFLQQPQPDFFRLHQLLMYRAIDDHIPTALQLITLERQYPPAFQMGLDMLARLKASNEIVHVLLARQTPLLAAKYVVSTRHDPANTLVDILHCASVLCDRPTHSEQQAKENPKRDGLIPVEIQFYTIFSLFVAHFSDTMQSTAFDSFRERQRTLTT